jgi:hypothetical protein
VILGFYNALCHLHGRAMLGQRVLTLHIYSYHQAYKGHQTNTRIITLRDVLYAPSAICNIFGLPEHSDYNIHIGKCGSLTDKDGKRAGLIDLPILPRLRLHTQQGRSSSASSLALTAKRCLCQVTIKSLIASSLHTIRTPCWERDIRIP